jgi:hypothetical protein
MEESKALAPRDVLSSTLLTVINKDETLEIMSYNNKMVQYSDIL